MTASLHELILRRIREHGPLTAAQYLELALYHPELGYYASAAQRSGRHGDFYTSVDVGTLFGEALAVQIAEMGRRLAGRGVKAFDLVEAGAGNGRLTRDILDALAREHPEAYGAVRVTLVDRSGAARREQPVTLANHLARIAAMRADLPPRVSGVIVANELLDALPVHVVEHLEGALHEIYVADEGGHLVERPGPLSTEAIAGYLGRSGVALPPGVRAEIGLEAERWMARAAGALDAGYLLLFDYGHEAHELYSPTHAAGTLMTFRAHRADSAHWLADPGHSDITAHVNLTAIRHAAVDAGLAPAGIVDQSYFLLNLGIVDRLPTGTDPAAIARRLAAKTLVSPGGLGSTMKAMAFATEATRPPLRGFASGRLT